MPSSVATVVLTAWITILASTADAAEPLGDGGYLDHEPIELAAELRAFEQARIGAIAHAIPAATSIFVPGGGGGGSGVVIDRDGFALTNFHVTSPAGNYMQCSMADGKIYDAVIVGIDPVGDLAMIQLMPIDAEQPPSFPAATIGDSRAAKSGDWSFVIGNPFLLAGDLQPTVTWGMLSGVGRYQYPSGTLLEYGDCLQTDASINPGNSGGPIYDAQGNVIGIVGRCSFEKRGRVNVGVGYAISIAQAMNFSGVLRAGRIADHATLGATVASDPDGGVRVSNLLESSDAYRRGMRYDSEVLRIDGRSVTTANDVQNILATYPAYWRVPITFRTDDQIIDTIVRLRSVHNEDELLEEMAGASPPPPPRPDAPKPIEDVPDGETPDDRKSDDKIPDDDVDEEPAAEADGDLPPAIAQRYEQRRGFANYHFNRLQQTEFIDALRNHPFAEDANDNLVDVRTGWIIEGKIGEAPVQVEVSDNAVKMTIDGDQRSMETPDELYRAVDQQDQHSILAPLSALRRMAIAGPQRFGETYAYGTAPLGGQRPLRRVTVSTDGPGEVRFFNHPDDLKLEMVEWFADRDNDPAELWIDRDDEQRVRRLRLRFGVDDAVVLDVESWKVSSQEDASES